MVVVTGVVHLRNNRATRHSRTLGGGSTWCGRKLVGAPTPLATGIQEFTAYGNTLKTTDDLDEGTCAYCKKAFDAAYAAAFPEGPKPIATFRLDVPGDLERARAVLSPEALTRFFGTDGGGMPAFLQALEGQSPSPERNDQ